MWKSKPRVNAKQFRVRRGGSGRRASILGARNYRRICRGWSGSRNVLLLDPVLSSLLGTFCFFRGDVFVLTQKAVYFVAETRLIVLLV